ncbi:MAG: hypothetical protein DWQ35_13820 [Planctomycetota bacterium]|nr:MAG: hypothetical protein DWQ35_13820 [Planctomycetota bacterium]REK25980.1 MAG: hypothetical protein DWQ42_10140 [Planctomycetota bacterium]REK46905.1 MAG: hypothetical protein DWQ46_05265 [Planctomycetota bacterium]
MTVEVTTDIPSDQQQEISTQREELRQIAESTKEFAKEVCRLPYYFFLGYRNELNAWCDKADELDDDFQDFVETLDATSKLGPGSKLTEQQFRRVAKQLSALVTRTQEIWSEAQDRRDAAEQYCGELDMGYENLEWITEHTPIARGRLEELAAGGSPDDPSRKSAGPSCGIGE